MEYPAWDHSILMPAAFTTLPHFSVSAASRHPTWRGRTSFVVTNSASRALMTGFASPALISWSGLSMISGGVLPWDPDTGNRGYYVARH
jgi:hypothetical protein